MTVPSARRASAVALATAGLLTPLLTATAGPAAAAGPVAALELAPAAARASAGTCVVHTVRLRAADGSNPSETPAVAVTLTEQPAADDQVLSFCAPSAPFANRGQSTATGDGSATGSRTAFGSFASSRAADGTVTARFGVRGRAVGGGAVRAFRDRNGNSRFDAGELASATASVTFTPGGTNADEDTAGGNRAQDAVRTLVEVPPSAGSVVVGERQTVSVLVRNQAGDTVSGVQVSGRVTAGPSAATATTAAAGVSCTVSDNAGRSDCRFTPRAVGTDTVLVHVNQTLGSSPNPDAGEPQLTAQRSTGTAPNSTPTEARVLRLDPESTSAAAGAGQTLVATVVDATGRAVRGVAVQFTEEGVGRFSDGTSRAAATTDELGQARISTSSVAQEVGTQVVVATIATAGTQCSRPANDPAGAPAGACADSSSVTYTAAGTPTPGPTTPAPGSLTAAPTVIASGQRSTISGSGRVGAAVQLYAYTRPSTTYRLVRAGTVGPSGTFSFSVVPPANTRLYAIVDGVTTAQAVVSVRSALSLTATPLPGCGVRATGRVRPALAGQLVDVVYRRGAGNAILLRTRVAGDGTYAVQRRTTGCGQTLDLTARTYTSLTTAGGVSAPRRVTLRR